MRKLIFILLLNILFICVANSQTTGRTLTVTKTGEGTVRSTTVVGSPAFGSINCGSVCSQGYNNGARVQLSASPIRGYRFDRWSGSCSGTSTSTWITLNSDITCTANFVRKTSSNIRLLTVTKTGSGTVRSPTVIGSPALGSIDCGSVCLQGFNNGARVQLTANPTRGYRFNKWSGSCSGTSTSTWITLNSDITCTANFVKKTNSNIRFLTVTKNGLGTVRSAAVVGSPALGTINCGSSCEQGYNINARVQLVANPIFGYRFDRWSGACSGTSTSAFVVLNTNKTCTANFVRKDPPVSSPRTLTVSKTGFGTVTSTPAGISCGSDCTHKYTQGTRVTLTATPDTGFRFDRWTDGSCSGTSDTTTVTMTANKSCTANFVEAVNDKTLTVSKTGFGNIISTPSGISCGSDCREVYNLNSRITLWAIPFNGYRFSGWAGDCSGTFVSSTVTLERNKTCRAIFTPPPNRFELNLTKAGPGPGKIRTIPIGVDCGTDCSGAYDENTKVTLVATPYFGALFTGWSGDCSGGTTPLTITMDSAKSCTATFAAIEPVAYRLTVKKSGAGAGTVSAEGLDCGNDCRKYYTKDTTATLTALPDTGSVFAGWSGDCSGRDNPATVTMNSAKSCTAAFIPAPQGQHTLIISKSGNGTGIVSSVPGGIDCGDDCSENYNADTLVTLTASADTGSVFTGWGGSCSGTTTTLAVTMDTAKSCTATFDSAPTPDPSLPQEHTLTLKKTGTGSGTVNATISFFDRITCGDNCSANYRLNSFVTLTARKDTGSVFTGWSGDCSGRATPIHITMNEDKTCTATFDVKPPTEITPPLAGDILVLDGSFLFAVNPTTGERVIAADFEDSSKGALGEVPTDIAMDSSGNILILDARGGTNKRGSLLSIDPATGQRTVISDFGDTTQGLLGRDSYGIAVDNIGTIFVIDSNAGTNLKSALFKVNLSNGGRALVSDFGNSSKGPLGTSPTGIAIDNSGKILVSDTFAGTNNRGILFSVDPATGTRTVISDLGDSVKGDIVVLPQNLSVDSFGNIILTDGGGITISKNGDLFSINPLTGQRTIISDFGDSSKGELGEFPVGVVLNSSGNIIVSDSDAGTIPEGSSRGSGLIFSVDPSTGQRTVISDFGDSSKGVLGNSPSRILIFTPPAKFALNINKTGNGAVTSSPAGIDCGDDCSENYNADSVVTLTASAETDSVFSGWSGDCSGSTTPLTVAMDSAKSCAATFNLIPIPPDTREKITDSFTASPQKDTFRTISSPGAGNLCDGFHTELSATITLLNNSENEYSDLEIEVATLPEGAILANADTPGGVGAVFTVPETGNYSDGILGPNEGVDINFVFCLASDSRFTLNIEVYGTDVPLPAAPQKNTLTITKSGTGTGTVASVPIGIDCGSDCDEAFEPNTSVTLTATPNFGSLFTGWSGDCSGSTTPLSLTMNAAKSCTANFDPAPPPTPPPSGDGETTPPPSEESGNGGTTSPPGNSGEETTSPLSEDGNDGTGTPTDNKFTLAVLKFGSGTAVSSDGLINCGADCTETYDSTTEVSLTATPSSGHLFHGWSGDVDCNDGTVTLDKDISCIAKFISTETTVPVTPMRGPGLDSVGATQADFTVSETGAANYTIPLVLPQGSGGLAPQLALTYNHQSGNGLLGEGWSVSGLSTISRCRQTTSNSGDMKPITYTNEDCFCLDGILMIPVQGRNGANGTKYRLETDSTVEITSHGGSGDNPSYFTVRRKDGTVSDYGKGRNSKFDAGVAKESIAVSASGGGNIVADDNATVSSTFSWSRDRITDRNGNYINFVHSKSSRVPIINQVRYAHGSGSAAVTVDFSYEGRINNSIDRTVSYIAGNRVRSIHRLKSITVTDGGTRVRSYTLKYRPGVAISQLSEVMECGMNGECYAPTIFSWTNRSFPSFSGFSRPTAVNTEFAPFESLGQFDRSNIKFVPADVDGDLKTDFIIERTRRNGAVTTLKNNNGSFSLTRGKELPGIISIAQERIFTVDYDGDGRTDVLYPDTRTSNRTWKAIVSDGTIDSGSPLQDTGIRVELRNDNLNETTILDINGDGLLDLVDLEDNKVYLLDRDIPKRQPAYLPYRFDTEPYDFKIVASGTAVNVEHLGDIQFLLAGHADYNGDGCADLLGYDRDHNNHIYIFSTDVRSDGVYLEPISVVTTDQGSTSTFYPVDINGDGNTDILQQHHGKRAFDVLINMGLGVFSEKDSIIGSVPKVSQVQFIDLNGDGSQDLFYEYSGTSYYRKWDNIREGYSTNAYRADTVLGAGFDSLYRKLSNDANFNNVYVADINGDGFQDVAAFHCQNVGNCQLRTSLQTRSEKRPPFITEITNGLGMATEIEYRAMTSRNVYRKLEDAPDEDWHYTAAIGSGSRAPVPKSSPTFDLLHTGYLVYQVRSTLPSSTGGKSFCSGVSLGTGINYNVIRYFYEGARVQANGRGFLGFSTKKTTECQNGIVTETNYRHDHPYIGLPYKTTTKKPDGSVLRLSTTEWMKKIFRSGGPYFIYKQKTLDKQHSPESRAVLKEVEVTQRADIDGNIERIDTVIRDGSSNVAGASSVSNTYSRSANGLFYGRVTGSAASHTNGQGTVRRSTAFTYTSSGQIASDEIDTGGSHRLKKDYTYDRFGNVTRETVSGSNITTRQTTYTYDGSGRYRNSETNALGHVVSTVLSRNALGLPLSVRNVDGVTATLAYDGFGRKTSELLSTGENEEISYWYCDSTCKGGVTGADYRIVSSSTNGSYSWTEYDYLGREVRRAARSFNSGSVYSAVDTEYDHRGLVLRVSEPYFLELSSFSGEPEHWTTYTYDYLGRAIRASHPDGTRTASSYNGLVTTVTNGLNQSKTETKNALDQTVRVSDALGGVTRYTFDPVGNVKTITDPAGNTVTNLYNNVGFKTRTIDRGTWSYTYNALGQVLVQTNGNGDTTAYTYDKLGRELTRIDRKKALGNNEGVIKSNAAWTWDSTANGKGKLASESDLVTGYSKSYGYDTNGRLIRTDTVIDGKTYTETTTYDTFGRVAMFKDAAGSGLGVQHVYRNNHLERVVEVGAYGEAPTGTSYFWIQSINARGQVEAKVYGNGTQKTLTFEPATGFLNNISSTNRLSGASIQDIDYTFDTLGNLTTRYEQRDALSGYYISEDFKYDKLNRLTSVTTAGQEPIVIGAEMRFVDIEAPDLTLTYDSTGNITFKSDVGTYTYGAGTAGPHAVTSAGKYTNFAYDSMGNMVSGRGRNIDYTVFGKPEYIDNSNSTTSFIYGTDRSRFKRVDVNKPKENETRTTRYVGNVEFITRPDGKTVVKRYIGGVAIHEMTLVTTENEQAEEVLTVETANLLYLHKDHQGSVTALTDNIGNIVQRFNYDAFGKRRNPFNFEGFAEADRRNFVSIADHTTTRGYTGHEHIDAADDLVHMGGRVYDSHLGRFLSPDPVTQDITNSQNLNPYTYVLNNPLSYTDPSGFFFKKLFQKIGSILQIGAAFVGKYIASVLCTAPTAGLCAPIVASIFVSFSSYAITAVATGDPSRALQAGLAAGVSAFAFTQIPGIVDRLGIENFYLEETVSIGLNGTVGGIFEELNGGQFGHGFLAAGLPKTLNLIPGANKLTNFDKFEDNTLNTVVRTSVAATVGGTVSRVTGGKFANGAVTAGFSWLLNFESSRIEKAQEQQGGTYSLREGLISAGGDREAIEAAYAGIAESFPGFGLDDKLLQTIFPDVDRSHPAYIEGRAVGPYILGSFGATTHGILRGSGFISITASRYYRAGGGGLNILLNNSKVRIGFDIHKIRLGGRNSGRDYFLPHIDIVTPTRNIKHIPFKQIDKYIRGVK